MKGSRTNAVLAALGLFVLVCVVLYVCSILFGLPYG